MHRPTVTAAVTHRHGALLRCCRSASTYTPASFGGVHAEPFSPAFGVSVERQYLGKASALSAARSRGTKRGGGNGGRGPPRAHGGADAIADDEAALASLPTSPLVRVHRHFGARVLSLESRDTANRLSGPLARALRQRLVQLEGNPAVTLIVLRGLMDGGGGGAAGAVFCGGATAALRDAAGGKAGPAGTLAALSALREQYRLAHVLATYTKPVVCVASGVALGPGAALLGHAYLSYATPESAIGFPDAADGIIPHGGSSYTLSRLPRGLGMYLALTGAVLRGQDAYWAGLTAAFGAPDVSSLLLEAGGDLSSDPRVVNGDMDADPVYARALRELRAYRDEVKMSLVEENMHEDVSREVFEQYLGMKRWASYLAAGDRRSAESASAHGLSEFDPTEPGDLFDFHASEAVNGRDTLAEPNTPAAEHRARIGAMAGHAAAIRDGLLPPSPPESLLKTLAFVAEAFGGNNSAVRPPVAPPPAPRGPLRPLLLAQACDIAAREGPLRPGWEARLPVSVEHAVMRTYEVVEAVPSRSELDALVAAVRGGVVTAWPAGGALNQFALAHLCSAHGVPDRTSTRDMVAIGVAYVTAKLLRLATPWALVDPALIARQKEENLSAAAAAATAAVGGGGGAPSSSPSSGSGGVAGGPSAAAIAASTVTFTGTLADLGLTLHMPLEEYWGQPMQGGTDGARRSSSAAKHSGGGGAVLIDRDGVEFTPRLATDIDGLYYDERDEDVVWNLYRRGETGPLAYGDNGMDLDIAMTRAAMDTLPASFDIFRGRHGGRSGAMATRMRRTLQHYLRWTAQGPVTYAGALAGVVNSGGGSSGAANRVAAAGAAALPDPYLNAASSGGVAPAVLRTGRGTLASRLTELRDASLEVRRIVIEALSDASGRRLSEAEVAILALHDPLGDPAVFKIMADAHERKSKETAASDPEAALRLVAHYAQWPEANLGRLGRKWRGIIGEVVSLSGVDTSATAAAAAGHARSGSSSTNSSNNGSSSSSGGAPPPVVLREAPSPPGAPLRLESKGSGGAPLIELIRAGVRPPPAVVLPAPSLWALSSALTRYAEAEAALLSPGELALVTRTVERNNPELEPWDVAHEKYVLAVDADTGLVTLALAPSVPTPAAAASSAAGANSGTAADTAAAQQTSGSAAPASGARGAASSGPAVSASQRAVLAALQRGSGGSSSSNAYAGPLLSPSDMGSSSGSSGSARPSIAAVSTDGGDGDDEDEDGNQLRHPSDRFDARHIRRALLEPEYLVDVFNMPRTRDTLAAAARVVAAFKEEAEGRVTAEPEPPSLDAIIATLRRMARQPSSREFAAGALRAMQAAPLGALQATHTLLAQAAKLSLPDAMALEYRVLMRMLTDKTAAATMRQRTRVGGRTAAAGSSNSSDSSAATSAAAGPASPTAMGPSVELIAAVRALFAPLEHAEDELSAGIVAPRKASLEADAARNKEMETWAKRLDAEYASGTMTGALGDVMRRRYSWYKKPLTSWDGGEFAPEREPIGDFSELKAVVDGTSEGAGAGLAADSSTGGAGMSPALLTLTGPAAKERAAEDAAFEALRDADPAIQKLFKGLGL